MADLFEEKAQDWDKNDLVTQLSRAVGESMLTHTELHNGMEVMDFGAGTGLITAQIADRVGKIAAVDTSAAMLERLAAKPELQGKVEALCQDITQQPLERQFDLIVSAMALHHVEDTERLLQRFHQHLSPGGGIALADLDQEDGSFHPPEVEGVFHDGFDRTALEAKLKQAGFGDIHFHTAHTVEKEDRHYPVFLVTARKN